MHLPARPSGVGKTTLLRLIAGLGGPGAPDWSSADDGRPLQGRVAYMAQQDLLLPWLGALDNVLRGLKASRREDRPRPDRPRAADCSTGSGSGDRLRA